MKEQVYISLPNCPLFIMVGYLLEMQVKKLNIFVRLSLSVHKFSLDCSTVFILNISCITHYVDPPVGWGSTYCFTAVGVGVGVLVGVGVTSITKAPPAQIFFGWHVFCSPGHWLLISAMTLTFGVKVKL